MTLDLIWNNPTLQPWILALLINTPIALLGILTPQKSLTRAGVIHAWILGLIVWGCWGWRGYAVVSVYFLGGTAVTKIGLQRKQAKGIAEKRGGARGPENVWGSALTGAICALGFLIWAHPFWWLAYCASFAAKLADTTSSEVGKAYGQKTFLITTLKPVPAGTEGAISLEGTLAGYAAALGLSLLSFGLSGGWIGSLLPWQWIGICGIAAIIATTVESWIGVVLQPKLDWLTNEVVNGIQTTLAALLALLLGLLILNLRVLS